MLNVQQQSLIQYGLNNMWCNPQMEKQILLKLARISQPSGALSQVKVMRSYITLPDKINVYHVFQVGQLFSSVVNLLANAIDWATPTWTNMSTAINNRSLIATTYTDTGIIIPNFEVYYMYTPEKDLIVAIKQDKNIPVDYTAAIFYLKLYSLINSSNAITRGLVAQTATDIVTIQNESSLLSGVKSYVNGRLVMQLDLISAKIGDTLEYVSNPSVVHTYLYPLNNLPSFVSTLDSKSKIILRSSNPINAISYFNDNEIYLVRRPLGSTYYQGVVHGHNNADSVRMVGRADYSIPTDDIDALALTLRQLVNPVAVNNDEMYVMLFVGSDSAYPHGPLGSYSSTLLEYLELLDNSYTNGFNTTASTNILTHSVSGLDEMSAANIEQSLFMSYMSMLISQINVQNTYNALGYSALVKNLGDFISVSNVTITKAVPVLLQNGFTAYEYDYNNILLASYSGNTGPLYNVVNHVYGTIVPGIYDTPTPHLSTASVEFRYGNESLAPMVFYGSNNVNIMPNVEYRVYRCGLSTTNVRDNKWVDITSNSTLYSVTNNILADLDLATGNHFFMIRTNETILGYYVKAAVTNGLLFVDMTESGFLNGAYSNYIMPVPMGELDVFLNGASLVEGIDYIVQFPRVVIFNKTHLVQPANTTLQTVRIRWTGFCDNNLQHIPCMDSGFILNSTLYSSAEQFLPVLDKSLRLTVNGSLVSADINGLGTTTMLVSLDMTGIILHNPSSSDGEPYALRALNTPTLKTLGIDSQVSRVIRDVSDMQLTKYFTSSITKRAIPTGTLTTLYSLFSPFISAIIDGFVSKNLTPIVGTLTDMEILVICKPFEYLLPFDPTRISDPNITKFIQVDPIAINTAVQLTRDEYAFVFRVVQLYTLSMNPLNSFITIV